MTLSQASSTSEYGSDIDWDEAAEAQLAAVERTAAAPPSSNSDDNTTATTTVGTHAQVEVGDAPDEGVVTAARLAEALRESGVVGKEDSKLPDSRSLWERFRQRRGWGALSVSDLSGPSWCEVQHSYRLASKPHLPPLQRPATIISSSGSAVTVDTTRTIKREAVLDKGKAVHAKIEREVMGPQEKVEVAVAGKEEWWAVRILNTIVCLETLLETGRVREVPVVGWVKGFLVFGVIDEIERREFSHPPPASTRPKSALSPASSHAATQSPAKPHSILSTPSKKKRVACASASTPDPDNQRKLHQFFSPIPSPNQKGKDKAADQNVTEGEQSTEDPDSQNGQQVGRTGLVLSDTKTRYNRSLPAKPESRAARLQLMLYHRLFTSLLQPEPPPHTTSSSPSSPSSSSTLPPPFSWSRLYTHLALDPAVPLSPSFHTSIQPIVLGLNLESTLGLAENLGDYVEMLGRYGESLRGERGPDRLLEEEIEISYRLRGGGGWKGRRGAGRQGGKGQRGKNLAARKEGGSVGREQGSDEDEKQLRRAIELSLQEGPQVATDGSTRTPLEPLEGGRGEATETHDAAHATEVEQDDSQVEDSQLPFLANPSLPLPPLEQSHTADYTLPSSSLPVLAGAFDLPRNSQSNSSLGDSSPAVSHPSRSGPYNFRRRPAPSSPVQSFRSFVGNGNATPPHKRPRSASSVDSSNLTAHSAHDPIPIAASASRNSPPCPPHAASSPSSSPPSISTSPTHPDPTLIGIETFTNDPAELENWLTSVSAYWRGERDPIGVLLSEVNRCRTCEFEDGCEWRASKAQESMELAREKRRLKEREKEDKRRV
ncbi:hypothetical protein JCM11641_004618 [Rhodosporidiobolus odoratus]